MTLTQFIASSEKQSIWILGNVKELHRLYLEDMLSGKCSAKRFLSLIKKETKFKGDLGKIWVSVACRYIHLDYRLMLLIDSLGVNYTIAMLSNISEMRSYIDEELDLYSHFDKLFLSYRLKMKKPNPKIFRYAMKKMKVRDGESILVDDQMKNLVTAKKFGIMPIHFRNRGQLVADFKKLGILC